VGCSSGRVFDSPSQIGPVVDTLTVFSSPAARQRRPTFNKHFEAIADKIAASTGQPREVVIGWLGPLLAALVPNLLKNLPCFKEDDPPPPDPNPNPTPQAKIARNNAWVIKREAEDAREGDGYKKKALRQAAAKIREQRRKKKDPINNEEARATATKAFDAAIATSLDEIQELILEAQSN
jgi:hypothetical protein